MRVFVWLCALAMLVGFAVAQAPPRTRVLGAITAVESSGVRIKNDSGETVLIAYLPETRFQKVAPGAKDLSNAQAITASDLAVGDRILVRGAMAPDGKILEAQSIVLMSAREIAQKNAQEQAEWFRHGIAGLVVSTDPAQKQIQIRIPSLFGQQHLATVALKENARLLRYSPDSVRFADAKPGTLEELKPGDQLRARGDKNEEGTHLNADEVITGRFRTAVGEVAALDAAANEVKLKDLQSGKVLTVKVTPDSVLRRLPQFGAGRMGAGPGPGSGAETGGGPGMGLRGAGAAGPGGMRRGAPDLQQMLEHMPAVTLNELKPGEAVVVSSTLTGGADRWTAVTLLAGADALIAMSRAAAAREHGAGAGGNGQSTGNWNLGDVSSMIPMQ